LRLGAAWFLLHADKAEGRKSPTLTNPERVASVQAISLCCRDNTVSHAQDQQTHHVGSPWLSKVRWFFADQPILLGFIALICVWLAVLLYRPFRAMLPKRFRNKLRRPPAGSFNKKLLPFKAIHLSSGPACILNKLTCSSQQSQ
jgi:hypothetical protein